MINKPSKALINFIAEIEGKSPTMYLDSAGYETIGIGHLINGNRDIYLETVLGGPYNIEDVILTEDQMYELYHLKKKDLLHDLNIMLYNKGIRELTQQQYDALSSFTFNLGPRPNSTLIKKLQLGDIEGAAKEFLKWKFAGGRFSQGILNRRIMEMNIFLTNFKYDDIIIPEDKTRVKDRNFIRSLITKYRQEFYMEDM